MAMQARDRLCPPGDVWRLARAVEPARPGPLGTHQPVRHRHGLDPDRDRILLLVYFLPPLLNWLFFSAQWTGSDRSVCATIAQGGIQPDGWAGACWAFVGAKFEQFMFNVYPDDERWRVILCA